MEFKGCVTNYTFSTLQGTTDEGKRQIPEWCRRNGAATGPKSGLIGINPEGEQGTRPRKIMVSIWFKHETKLDHNDRYAQ